MAKRTRTNDLETLELVNAAEKLNDSCMKRQLNIWRDCTDAMQNKLPVTDPYSPNITVGRLAADIETIVPRDVQSLLGNKPYMPYGATDKNNPEATDYASAITDNIDYYTERGSLYTTFADGMKICRPKGICYIEPRWAFLPVSIYQKNVEKDALGRVVSVSEFYEDSVDEAVDFRILDPESVKPHPFGNTLDAKPNVCVVELVHKNEIKRLLETEGSGYKLAKDVTEEMLFSGIPESMGLQEQNRRDKGELTGDAYKDVCVLVRYYSDERWIHVINRNWVVMDTENQNKNMPKNKKPFAALRNMSHIGMDRYWPIGDYEFMMDLYWLGDMWLNMYAKAAQMYSAQWILFNESSGVRAEDLKPTAGLRIPIQDAAWGRAIETIKIGEPPAEYLEFYRESKGIADNRIHINDYVAGREPSRKETATAVNQLAQAGLTHMEFGVTYIEQGGLTDLAYLTAKVVAANQSDAQRARILGWDRAQRIMTADPEAIPGGYVLNFKGSDRVQRQQQKAEKVLQGYDLVRNQTTILEPWRLDRIALETLEVFSGDQLDAMGLSAEAQQAMQQQAAMANVPPPPPAPSVSDSTAIMDPNQIGLGAPMAA